MTRGAGKGADGGGEGGGGGDHGGGTYLTFGVTKPVYNKAGYTA